MREAVIIDAVRTPVGKRGGQLKDWHPTDLLAHTIHTLVERTGVAPERLADVITGCAIQSGEQAGNIGRWAALGAGLPQAIAATTIDRAAPASRRSTSPRRACAAASTISRSAAEWNR
jgi:acetyl-CoA C-acetyltransferase